MPYGRQRVLNPCDQLEPTAAHQLRRFCLDGRGLVESEVAVGYVLQFSRGDAIDWKTKLAYITGSVGRELLLRNEYLFTETPHEFLDQTGIGSGSEEVCSSSRAILRSDGGRGRQHGHRRGAIREARGAHRYPPETGAPQSRARRRAPETTPLVRLREVASQPGESRAVCGARRRG